MIDLVIAVSFAAFFLWFMFGRLRDVRLFSELKA
jgi:hypothetical protein